MQKIMCMGLWVVALLLVHNVQVWGYEEVLIPDGGTIVGTVTYKGPLRTLAPLRITKDQEVCGKTEKFDETLILGAGQEVQNAVVSLMGIEKGKRFVFNPITLDQKECKYIPHVLLVPVGTDVSILNSDGILHNFRTHSIQNPPINKAQPKFKKTMREKFSNPEIIKVTCDAHAWMVGWIVIAEHPYYAVTDSAGKFTLGNVPPGTYTINIWHEALQQQKSTIVVSRESQAVNVEMYP